MACLSETQALSLHMYEILGSPFIIDANLGPFVIEYFKNQVSWQDTEFETHIENMSLVYKYDRMALEADRKAEEVLRR